MPSACLFALKKADRPCNDPSHWFPILLLHAHVGTSNSTLTTPSRRPASPMHFTKAFGDAAFLSDADLQAPSVPTVTRRRGCSATSRGGEGMGRNVRYRDRRTRRRVTHLGRQRLRRTGWIAAVQGGAGARLLCAPSRPLGELSPRFEQQTLRSAGWRPRPIHFAGSW